MKNPVYIERCNCWRNCVSSHTLMNEFTSLMNIVIGCLCRKYKEAVLSVLGFHTLIQCIPCHVYSACTKKAAFQFRSSSCISKVRRKCFKLISIWNIYQKIFFGGGINTWSVSVLNQKNKLTAEYLHLLCCVLCSNLYKLLLNTMYHTHLSAGNITEYSLGLFPSCSFKLHII